MNTIEATIFFHYKHGSGKFLDSFFIYSNTTFLRTYDLSYYLFDLKSCHMSFSLRGELRREIQASSTTAVGLQWWNLQQPKLPSGTSDVLAILGC